METTAVPPSPSSSNYPVTFSVEYPERQLNRLTTFFRAFTVIPIGILVSLLPGGTIAALGAVFSTGSLVVFPVVLMLLFRKKYPRWWFDWNLELVRFSNRIGVYAALMDDRYPSTDERQSVQLDYVDPDPERLERGLPLVKWLLAIPHYLVLAFLYIGVVFAVIGAWFAILFTGRYPRGIFSFVEGVLRWGNRVYGYAFTLVTDEYPPFRLKP
jgi:amino acid permease